MKIKEFLATCKRAFNMARGGVYTEKELKKMPLFIYKYLKHLKSC